MIAGRFIRLRPIEPEDLSFMAKMTNDRDVAGMVAGWDFPVALHSQRSWLEESAGDRSAFRFTIVGAEGEPIGMTGLFNIDWHSRHAIAPIKLYQPALRQKGTGTDVVKTLMAWAFYDVGLQKLQGSILDSNGASCGL